MQVSVETTKGLERRMTVSLPTKDIDTKITERLNKARNTVSVNGFRKGKVPMSVLQQRFGPGVRQEVLSEMINKSYGEALQEQDIRPAGQPTIEPLDDEQAGDELSYTAVFEVYPTVKLSDFSKIKLEKAKASVEDTDVADMLETLRTQNAEWTTVERAAADGDTVIIDFKGSIDGDEFDGGSAEGSSLVLGSGNMIPGFESGIVGMNVGETRNIEVTFPKDYQAEQLQGKDAVFAITLNEVKESELPELNEEFIAKFAAEGSDLESFKVEVRTNMERELEAKELAYLKNQVMDALADKHKFDLPAAMVKEETARAKQEMFQQYGQGADIDLSQFPDEPFLDQAQRRVKLGLVISEIVTSAELAADADSVKAEITKMASSYEKPEEVEQYYYGNENMLNSIQMKVLEDQVVAHIVDAAKVKDVSLSYSELMAKK